MAERARIMFGGVAYPITPDLIPGIVAKLNDLVTTGGGSSVLEIGSNVERSILFWTPGAPIAFETWNDDTD